MINQSYLEKLLAPYAKAPVDYPDSLDPVIINYMKKSIKRYRVVPKQLMLGYILLKPISG
jgi:hypothetical protein